jgi:xylulokinase
VPLVLGVDSSTQSTKVEVRDAETGALVAHGRAPHPPTTPPRSEQDPQAWWDALEAAVAQAGAPAREAVAIAVAGQQHGMVTLDAGGDVVRPAKLWNDTETAPDAAWLLQQLDADAWAHACGSVPVAAFTIAKLSWLHRSEPDAWSRVARVCLPHDWLTWKLTGAFVTDRGDASGTGYFSAERHHYCADLLAIVDADADWSTRLPRVLAPTETAGTTQAFGAEAVVGPGTGDNMAAALALALPVGHIAVSLGTSGTVYTVSETPTADASGAVAGVADATGRYLPLVCTLNATKVTDTVADWLGVDAAGLDALALAASPGADGLVLVPHLDGERTPNRPDATGVLAGLRSDVTREQLARAAVEGVVCNILAGADHLGAEAAAVVLVGGGARGAAYRQVVADLSSRPVLIPDADEIVSLGAALQAAAVLSGRPFDEVADAWGVRSPATTIDPDPTVDAAAIRASYAAAVGP